MNHKGLKVLLFLTVAFFLAKNTYGQTSISGIINNYTPVTLVNTTCNALTVSSPTGFNVGGKVLLIQMKGATVNGGQTANFGIITSYGNAGNYEFNEIYAIQGAIIYLKYTILKTYDPVGLQLVTIPQYGDVTINGTLTASPWDGNIGGVLVFESSGTLTFNADINIEGLGFRGGDRSTASSLNNCSYGMTTFYAALNSDGYGEKGESISGYIIGKEVAQANQASGGGGGHSSNSGGGGGGNYGKGGIGGNQSNKPGSTFSSCNFFGVGAKGMGGVALTSNYSNSLNKIFLGGGGGGGQQNNYAAPGPPIWTGATAGNPGGGIVIIRAVSIVGNNFNIYADGYNNNSLNASTLVGFANGMKWAWGDSGGGGGAGGTVLLSASNYSTSLNVDVRGGRGDSVYTDVELNLGPGGGGGGGLLWVNSATSDPNITTKITGGVTGISFNSAFSDVCCSFGSAAGDPGTVLNSLVIPENTAVFSACVASPINLLSYTGGKAGSKVYLNWSTATEINNDHFVIEKSNDGKIFDYLTSVAGHGNSNVVLNYSYTDSSPLAGLNYYCLKQYDYNGVEHTLGYIVISSLDGKENGIEKIYPNPFSNELIIQTSEVLDKSKTSVRVINLLGAEMTSVTSLFEGQNIRLNAAVMDKGIYYLQLVYEDKIEIRKIIKE